MKKTKVNVKCFQCKKESLVELITGENKEHLEDFFIGCPECDNWESGQLPPQGFELLD